MSPDDPEPDRLRLGQSALHTFGAERLAGPARAILGYQALLAEQVQMLGPTDIADYLEDISAAAAALDLLIAGLIRPGAERTDDSDAHLRHDLRTPLNAIIGFSEIMVEDLSGGDYPELLRDLAVILSEANGLLALINETVDFRQLSSATTTQAEGIATGLATSISVAAKAAPVAPGRVLVVDDVASNRTLLSRRLGQDGHQVHLAGSGAEALRILASAEVDLILLDVLMPEMNGLEVLTRLRSHRDWARLPVIMISGLKEDDAVIRCIEAGADDYLVKPFDPVLLRARVGAGLERKRWADREARYLQRIEVERDRADALLHAILPAPIVLRLNDGEEVIADHFEAVTIIFADLVGFTSVAARTPAATLVRRLDAIFTAFDAMAEAHGVEKIKTIGDAYMAAAGVPDVCADHADRVMRLAWDMLGTITRSDPGETPFQLRIGVHSGPVVAGLIGRRRFVYDVWGEAVNIASRLEFHGAPGTIQFSDATRRLLTDDWPITPLGRLALKGGSEIEAFRIAR